MTRDLHEVAPRLGLTTKHRRWGPCPACRASVTSDRRPPLRITAKRWWCNACPATGDAVDLVSWHQLGRAATKGDAELRQVFAFLDDGTTATAPATWTPAPEPERHPPTPAEVAAFLRACPPAASDPAVAAYLTGRHIDPTKVSAGAVPLGMANRWWPLSWSRSWRLVVPAFDGDGRLRILHARAIDGSTPKTRWPLNSEASGVLFASRLGRALLRGEAAPTRLLVTEGLPDFLDACSQADDDLAVLSVESGSTPAFDALRERLPASTRVYVSTHADLAGDRYAQGIADALAPHPCRRVPLDLLRRRAA